MAPNSTTYFIIFLHKRRSEYTGYLPQTYTRLINITKLLVTNPSLSSCIQKYFWSWVSHSLQGQWFIAQQGRGIKHHIILKESINDFIKSNYRWSWYLKIVIYHAKCLDDPKRYSRQFWCQSSWNRDSTIKPPWPKKKENKTNIYT